MAKPSTRNGFIPGSYDWLASIVTAGLRDLEFLVYLEVCFQVYGLARLESARLSPADIARRAGKKPPNVSKAIAGCIAKNVIARRPDGSYVPVEDHESWRLDESDEERAARLKYVADAPGHAKSFRPADATKGADPGATTGPRQLTLFEGTDQPDRQSTSIHRDTATVSNGILNSIHRDTATVSNGILFRDHPIEERARGIENLREKLRRGGEANSPPESSLPGTGNGGPTYDPDPAIASKQRKFDEYLASMNGRAK